MNTDKLVEFSRWFYGRLLGFYPKEHRNEYGQEMTRLFSDQCNSTIRESGMRGMLTLWLRTFWDLGKSALVEHFSASFSTTGLLQGTLGKPLPWKGVFLVLVPGLAFFICQIGTLNGKDWFFSILPWLGYACMVPVLLVWIFTKKFPVWGLIPLGLVIANLRWDVERQVYNLSLLFIVPLRSLLQPHDNPIVGDGEMGVPLMFFVFVFILGWLLYRRHKFNRTAWLWLGLYTLTVIASLIINVIGYLKTPYWSPKILQAVILSMTVLSNSDSIFFLLLILLGALLVSRHGNLAILILVGYLLPTVLYGYYETYAGGNTADISPLWINTSIFAFRLCLAILIPVWLARSATWCGQILATIVPVTIALVAQAGLQIARYGIYNPVWPSEYVGEIFVNLLMTITGFILALVMYRSIRPSALEMVPAGAQSQVGVES